MGTMFSTPIAIYTVFLQVSKPSSLYKHPVACDLFKTELLHFQLVFTISRVRSQRACVVNF